MLIKYTSEDGASSISYLLKKVGNLKIGQTRFF